MADPVVVTCPKDTWQIVATGVTSGWLYRIERAPGVYLQTYRDTGGAAPVGIDEGVPVFVDGRPADISAVADIDVYIYAAGAAGSVRADL